MSRARGVVNVEVLGGVYRLRASLAAIDVIESRLGRGFLSALEEMKETETLKVSTVLVMFEEMARAGGTPLGADQREDLTLEDLAPIAAGISRAAQAGIGEGGKKKPEERSETAGSPGAAGSSSPSAT